MLVREFASGAAERFGGRPALSGIDGSRSSAKLYRRAVLALVNDRLTGA